MNFIKHGGFFNKRNKCTEMKLAVCNLDIYTSKMEDETNHYVQEEVNSSIDRKIRLILSNPYFSQVKDIKICKY